MNTQDILKDSNFLALPAQEKRKVLQKVDPNYAALPKAEQNKVIGRLSSTTFAAGMLPPSNPDYDSSSVKKKVSSAAHTILPVLGGTLGTIAGAAPAATGVGAPEAPYSMVIGGWAGTALGEQGADALDNWLGLTNPTTAEAAKQALENVYTGAEQEAIGLGVAAPIGAIAKRLPKALKVVGEGISGKQLDAPSKIPGYKETYGMRTGNLDDIGTERAFIDSGNVPGTKEKAGKLLQENKKAVSQYLRNASDGNVDDFTHQIQRNVDTADEGRAALDFDAVEQGNTLRKTVNEAKKPYQATMEELEKQIPDYPIEASSITHEFNNFINSPKSSDEALKIAQIAKKAFTERVQKFGQTTHSLMGYNRTLNDLYDIAKTDSQRRTVTLLKKALRKDLEAFSAKARTGEVKVYDGKTYYPDDLAGKLERNATEIAKERAKVEPDMLEIGKRLQQKGLAASPNTGVSEESFLADAERMLGELPTKQGANNEYVNKLVNESKDIKELIGKLEPGQDVASLMNAYNKYANKEFFGRFDTDIIKSVSDPTRKAEHVVNLFKSPTDFDQLSNAVGKDVAVDAFRKNFQSTFSKSLGSDKTINTWFRKNAKMLVKTGLFKEFKDIVKTQKGYNQAVKLLEADNPKAIFDELLKGNRGSQAKMVAYVKAKLHGNEKALEGFRKGFFEYVDETTTRDMAAGKEGFSSFQEKVKKIDPMMKKLLTPSQYEKVMTARRAINKYQLLTNGPVTGGSQTAELLNSKATNAIIKGKTKPGKLDNAANLVGSTVVGGVTGKIFGPWQGAIAAGASSRFIRTMQEAATKRGNEAVWKTFERAMFDPDYAATLLRAVKGDKYGIERLVDLTSYLAAKTAIRDRQPAPSKTYKPH